MKPLRIRDHSLSASDRAKGIQHTSQKAKIKAASKKASGKEAK